MKQLPNDYILAFDIEDMTLDNSQLALKILGVKIRVVESYNDGDPARFFQVHNQTYVGGYLSSTNKPIILKKNMK